MPRAADAGAAGGEAEPGPAGGDPPPRFQQLRNCALALVVAGCWADALPLALAAETRFPDKGEVPFWIACVQCRLGAPERALAALRAGLTRGHYWPDDWLFNDDDLEPLRERPELADIARESAAVRASAAAATAEPLEPVVLAGGGAAPAAVVLALHGWGQDADEFSVHWQAAATRGYTIVVARSRQQPTPGFCVWDDRDVARREVLDQLRRAVAHRGLAAAPLLTAGFSQGAGLAVELALDDGLATTSDGFSAAGFLAVAGGVKDAEPPPNGARFAAAAGRGMRGRVLVGDRDGALEDAHELAAAATAAGLRCVLTVTPGAGHEMPEPPGEPLAGELAALFD